MKAVYKYAHGHPGPVFYVKFSTRPILIYQNCIPLKMYTTTGSVHYKEQSFSLKKWQERHYCIIKPCKVFETSEVT